MRLKNIILTYIHIYRQTDIQTLDKVCFFGVSENIEVFRKDGDCAFCA